MFINIQIFQNKISNTSIHFQKKNYQEYIIIKKTKNKIYFPNHISKKFLIKFPIIIPTKYKKIINQQKNIKYII